MAKILTAFKWNPIVYELAQTRHEIQEEMERQGVTIDMSKLTDLNLLKRRVLKSCIYGVDLNPMAVELAKVSLWLDCFTLGAPLSFLDHHMKCGNSLIGGNMQEVQEALSRDLFGHQFAGLLSATQLMRKVGELSDVTAQEVAESRKAYKGAYDALAPFKRLLDVWISEYFGNKKARITTSVYAGAIVADNYSKANSEDKKAIEKALALAKDKRFYHWELEFPEVFFDETKRKENGGFDAVVGNPPYIPNEQMQNDERDYFSICYPVSSGKYDLSVVFLKHGSELLSSFRRLGMIVPTTWQTGDNYVLFRENNFAQGLFGPSIVVNLPFDVFPDAYIDTCIAIFSKPAQNKFLVFAYAKKQQVDQIGMLDQEFDIVSIDQLRKESQHRIFTNSRLYGFLTKLSEPACIALGAITDACQGPVETFFEYSDLAKGEDDLPYVSCDVYRYEIEIFQRRFIHFGKDNPLTKFYTQPRILVRRIVSRSNRLMATAAKEPFVVKKDLNPFVLTDHLYNLFFLLASMNSRLFSYLYTQASTAAGKDDFRQTTLAALRALPIRRINFTTLSQERTYYLEKVKNLYEYCLSKDDPQCVLGFVDHHLSQQPEEADVVHDLLAFLAEEMIRLNKEKRAAQREFLDWLVTAIKVLPDKEGHQGIDVLTGKAKLADYPGDYQKNEPSLTTEELLDILRKNKNHLSKSLSDANLIDRIKKTYEESLQRVLPLKERLARTDRLIDQVVYRLYGLTEEEIGVVEGRG